MQQKSLLGAAVLGLTVALSACSQPVEDSSAAATTNAVPPADSSPLTGVWEMTSLTVAGEPVPYSGRIAFTADTVAVQASNPDTAAPDTPYAVAGYEAYYGGLSVDDAAGVFAIDVESAAARDLVGQTLTRTFEVIDDELVLTPTDPSEGFRVTYERLTD